MTNNVFEQFDDDTIHTIAERVAQLLGSRPRVLIAIDGNCCAGKTTAAKRLGSALGASVFHMDDFFLQPHMRTPERMAQPGGNVDAERFLSSVLLPASRGETARVRRYDCHADMLLEESTVAPGSVVIVEGTYSLHPMLAPYHDLKLFCRVSSARQVERVLARNGEDGLKAFTERWIPLENRYFDALDIEKSCDFIIDTTIV
ncbi:MAG: uridine kinase [Eubacteriales bacterium]